jgi:hypothetical protein
MAIIAMPLVRLSASTAQAHCGIPLEDNQQQDDDHDQGQQSAADIDPATAVAHGLLLLVIDAVDSVIDRILGVSKALLGVSLGLIHLTFGLGLFIASELAPALFGLAFDLIGHALNPIVSALTHVATLRCD